MYLEYNNVNDDNLVSFFRYYPIEEGNYPTTPYLSHLPPPLMSIQYSEHGNTDYWLQLWEEKYEEDEFYRSMILLYLSLTSLPFTYYQGGGFIFLIYTHLYCRRCTGRNSMTKDTTMLSNAIVVDDKEPLYFI